MTSFKMYFYPIFLDMLITPDEDADLSIGSQLTQINICTGTAIMQLHLSTA